MPRHLNKLFRRPPRGGNERGVQTHNPMSPLPPSSEYELTNGGEMESARTQSTGAAGPARQRGLREQMQAGENSARASMVESRQAGSEDFRNYKRSPQPVAGSGYAGYEARKEREGSAGTATGGKPTPRYNQDTTQPRRSDGKPHATMGTANGNRSSYQSEDTSRSGPFD